MFVSQRLWPQFISYWHWHLCLAFWPGHSVLDWGGRRWESKNGVVFQLCLKAICILLDVAWVEICEHSYSRWQPREIVESNYLIGGSDIIFNLIIKLLLNEKSIGMLTFFFELAFLHIATTTMYNCPFSPLNNRTHIKS